MCPVSLRQQRPIGLGKDVYTSVAMDVIGTPNFNYLDRRVNTFGNIEYISCTLMLQIFKQPHPKLALSEWDLLTLEALEYR